MKKVYSFAILFSIVLFSSCSKDILKSYDKRIIGTWEITNVKNYGLGGNTDNLPFGSGNFTFYDNGSLDYVNSANVSFKGSWQIEKKIKNDETVHSLQITAVDFTNQQVLAEYYDDINFVSTNHFRADIIYNFHTYVTHFKR
jgi:hypothetical protein